MKSKLVLMHIAPHDVMQLLRKDVCRLSEDLWKSQVKLSKEGSLTGVPKASFFLFARAYKGRNIWTVDSKHSQGPSQIVQCSVSGNAVGISYLTHRELNQEIVFVLLCKKIQIQSKNSCQDFHVLELRIPVLVLICHQCWKSLFLKAGSWGSRK